MAEENGSGDHGARGFASLPLLLSVIIRLLTVHLEFLVTASGLTVRPREKPPQAKESWTTPPETEETLF